MTLIALLISASTVFASPSWSQVKAVYEVPVPQELKAYAQFSMKAETRNHEGVLEARYELPQELTGRRVVFEAAGRDEKAMKGPLGEMSCEEKTCAVRYPALNIDALEVENFLKSQGISGAELEARLQVSKAFSLSDPAGFVHYEKSPY